MSEQKHIIVVGAGVIGASIAYRLICRGATVTVVDQGTAGGVASSKSFGWVNATYENPRPYYDLRKHAMDLWPALAKEVPETSYQRNGTIYVHFDGVDLDQFYREHRDWGYNLSWIDQAELRDLEPNLKTSSDRSLLCPEEALVEPHKAAAALIAACRRREASILENRTVTGLITIAGRITGIETNQGPISADEVVIACGDGTPQLAKSAGVRVPMKSPPGLLVYTKPLQPLIRHTLLTSGLHIQQKQEGGLLAGADFGGGAINDDPESGAQEIMSRIRSALMGAENAEFDRYTLGLRPTPLDGMPVIGRPLETEGLYVSVMHSGATLAAGISELAAMEIMSGVRDPLLQPFGVNRFS